MSLQYTAKRSTGANSRVVDEGPTTPYTKSPLESLLFGPGTTSADFSPTAPAHRPPPLSSLPVRRVHHQDLQSSPTKTGASRQSMFASTPNELSTNMRFRQRSPDGSLRYNSPPNYDDIAPFAVLITCVPNQTPNKLQHDNSDLPMNTLKCSVDMRYVLLKEAALKAARDLYPNAIGVDMRLCCWLGMAIGKHKLMLMHKINHNNHDGVLLGLHKAPFSDFGIALCPVFEEKPGILQRMKNALPGQKKRKRDIEEAAGDVQKPHLA